MRIWELTILVIVFILLVLPQFSLLTLHAQSDNPNIGYVHDIIEPTLDEVKWSEEGGMSVAPWWVADGTWNSLSIQESLVSPGNIFVSWDESFNWTRFENAYAMPFTSMNDFANNITSSPLWWLNFWGTDPEWSGITANASKVQISLDDNSSTVNLSLWFHITRIPEYFEGRGGFQNWLAGFDLTSVSTGAMTAWEFHEDWTRNGWAYNLYFRAPAHVLSQQEDNYTFSMDVASSYRGNAYNTSQIIEIDMPANTEIKEMTPSSLAVHKANAASFVKAPNDAFPDSFMVVSGLPAKSLGQIIADDVSLWFLTPGGWAAIGSLLVLSFTGFRGRRIWNRNKLYHRLYKSMVSIYDMYEKDLLKFHQEMDNISRTIIKMLVEDKINDEQFEKLLKRRDDLIIRAQQ